MKQKKQVRLKNSLTKKLKEKEKTESNTAPNKKKVTAKKKNITKSKSLSQKSNRDNENFATIVVWIQMKTEQCILFAADPFTATVWV